MLQAELAYSRWCGGTLFHGDNYPMREPAPTIRSRRGLTRRIRDATIPPKETWPWAEARGQNREGRKAKKEGIPMVDTIRELADLSHQLNEDSDAVNSTITTINKKLRSLNLGMET